MKVQDGMRSFAERLPRLYYVAPALMWAAMIFGLSSQTGEGLPGWIGFPGLDKLAHFAVYAILAALTGRALARGGEASAALMFAAFGLAAVYGLSDEIHQHFVPGRHFSWLDWLADVVGAGAGALVWRISARRRGGP